MASQTPKAKSTSNVKSVGSKKSKSTGTTDDQDNRSGLRVPVQLLVDYQSGGNYLFDFCRDLGTGGAFIQTLQPLKTGSDIEVTFTIPDSKETLSTKGKVIWVQDAINDRPDLIPGMGVQFAGFNEAQRETLERFIERYANKNADKNSTKTATSRSA